MQIVFSDSGRRVELEVLAHRDDATVADLVAALAPGRTAVELEADGAIVPATRRLDRAGIRCGAVVRVVAVGSPPAAARPAVASVPCLEVVVAGGLDAGARGPVGPGRWALGRDTPTLAVAHDTVSAHHLTLVVDPSGAASVSDEGSRNGTWVDGRPCVEGALPVAPTQVVRVGAVQLQIRPTVDDDRPTASAAPGRRGPTVPFNRPPRAAPAPPPTPLVPPEPAAPPRATSTLGVASVLGPLIAGAALVAVTRQPAFALLLLLSPITALATAWEGRRRRRRGRRRDDARFRRELADLRAALDRARDAERARLELLAPDPAEVLRRIETPSTHLWERRSVHADWLVLRAGIGPTPWTPPISRGPADLAAPVRDALDDVEAMVDAPVPISLAGGGVIGVVGPRPAALAVARSLVIQAAAHHGPADLSVLALTAADRLADWDWAKWLPHLADPEHRGTRGVVADPDRAATACRTLLDASERTDDDPTTLVVVDDDDLVERSAPLRGLLRGRAGPVAGIVVASSDDRLPASCSAIVSLLDGDGSARVVEVGRGEVVDDVVATGVAEATARRAARGLAHLADPERAVEGAGLPAVVPLVEILGLDGSDPDAIARRWAAAGVDPPLVTPLGLTEDGVLELDLARDGPHALVAGTTGAGKSELLRSLVAGLAAGSPPEACTFVLVDFKGGSAFDRCASLPHTVGLVTDLDAHLAERALRCLHAELRHRERVLRAAGAADLSALRRGGAASEPLPRLVVVVDEFATLRAELPDFVDSLVGIAQRGRSLGVHLVLATQRPSGAVSESIRANTDIRIALRVQDPADSTDVVDGAGAARISRNRPGRALARLGPGEVVAVQTALSTGARRADHATVEVRPFHAVAAASEERPAASDDDASDLARLVAVCVEAHAASGRPLPRRPWPDPLPPDIDLDELLAASPGRSDEVVVALADRPDDQVQTPFGWRPAEGNLVLAGLPGSGTTTALATVALSWGRAASPDDLHIYAIDAGSGGLAPLGGLPHAGAVVAVADRERQARLVAHLRAEVDRRRGAPDPTAPRILLLVDGLATFRAEWDDAGGEVLDAFARVFAEGPDVGVHVAVAADRTAALPAPLRALVRQQLLFALGDDGEYAAAGLRPRELPTFVPGRAIDAALGVEVQVARPHRGIAEDVAHCRVLGGPASRPAAAVAALPQDPDLDAVLAHVDLDATPRRLPLGIGEATLGPAGLVLHPGEHALVAGPARSGRTTALVVAGLGAAHAGWRTVAVAGPRSALAAGRWDALVPHDHVGSDLVAAIDGSRPTLVLVDDAEAVDPDGRVVPGVLARPGVVVVAAGRADVLRGSYAHWTRTVRRSRVGVLLVPDVDLDGDLFGVRLPRRSTTAIGPGRGYACEAGVTELVQIARPVR